MTIGRIPSVEGGIQPTIVDAKGDLIAATAADTVNRLAVGSNDQILVADSSASTGLAWKSYGAQFVAGKNKIINGDFSINQRSFSSTTSSGTYTFDRWVTDANGGTFTYSSQAFTAGAAPVTGYESTNFLRCVTSGQTGSNYAAIIQRIEDVRTLANQTATVSFWAKAASGTPSILIQATQRFGSGGSTAVATNLTAQVISTSWARYSVTFTVPSISGKTIGTGSNLEFNFFYSLGSGSIGVQNNTFDIWGVQVEAGSVATPFTTATGTIQGELAACQRYYWRSSASAVYSIMSPYGTGTTTTGAYINIPNIVTMRVQPTSVDYSTLQLFNNTDGGITVTNVTLGNPNPSCTEIAVTVAAGVTVYRPYAIRANNSTSAYIAFNAEL